MLNAEPVMLIGGTGRSGTTILAKIIATHPDVATLPEWRLLSDPGGILEFLTIVDGGNPFCIDQAYKRLEAYFSRLESKDYFSRFIKKYFKFSELLLQRRVSHRYYNFHAPSYIPDFTKHRQVLTNRLNNLGFIGTSVATQRFQGFDVFATNLDRDTLDGIFSDFLMSIASDAMNLTNSNFFLEKNTWSILNWSRVSRLYPYSKLVHIYRDPRDVVSSFVSQPWMPSEPKHAAEILYGLYEKWEEQSSLVEANRWMEISLEKLIASPREMLVELCDFWNLEFSEEMLSVKLNNKSTNRWKKDLSTQGIKDIELVLGKYIDKYAVV